MTAFDRFDRFERNLPALFDELATARMPDYTDDLLARTQATRQRPGWAFPERWLPMSALARRFAAVPRVPWRLGVLVALLAAAALIAAMVAGSILDRRPAPFGPAANGSLAFVDPQGRILLGDPLSRATVTLAADSGNTDPLVSQDGSRVFYIHEVDESHVNLMVVNADGTGTMRLNEAPILPPDFGAWSARGDLFAIVTASGQLLLYDTSRTAPARNLSDDLDLGRASIGLGYNFRSTHAFRPPAGSEILFSTRGTTLSAVGTDGNGLRVILDRETSPVPFLAMTGAEWSPDGSRIAVLLQQAPYRDRWHAHVMNADGTDLRPLGELGSNPMADQNSLLWSPDGTRLAYQYWIRHAADDGQDFNPIGIIDVASGTAHDVGPLVGNGFVSWEWSPDGSAILEVPQDGSGDVLIVDAEDGTWTTAPWIAAQTVAWQRVAK